MEKQIHAQNELAKANLPRLAELYDIYGYIRPDEEMTAPKQLGFEVNDKLTQQISGIAAKIILNKPVPDDYGELNDQLEKIDLGGKIFEISDFVGTSTNKRNLRFRLYNDENERIIDFFVTRDKDDDNKWDLGHRLVDCAYRAQKLGTKMIRLIEASLQEISQQKGQDQELIIETGQLGVMLFALKNDYQIVDNDLVSKLIDIISGNKNKYLLATGKGYAHDGRVLPGFVYERQKLVENINLHDIEINSEDLDDFDLDKIMFYDPDEYSNRSIKIKFIKKFIQNK
jgi:hypothetical protein